MHQVTEDQINKLEVRFLRLHSGDDIVCYAVKISDQETDDYEWYIQDALIVIMDIDPEMQSQSLIMLPWLPRGVVKTNDALLPFDEVMLAKEVDPEIIDYYKGVCREIFTNKPKILSSNMKKASEYTRNVSVLDLKTMRKANNEHNKANT